MSQDWIEELGLSKPGMMVNKEFLAQVKERFDDLENALSVERRKRETADSANDELREKIEKFEGDIFGCLERISSEEGKIIGLKDKEDDPFYLRGCDPSISKLREEVSTLKEEVLDLKSKNKKLNQNLRRAKRRYIHAEETCREVTKESGLKVVFSLDGFEDEESGFPFDVPEIYDPRVTYPLSQISYYKGKIWIHKTEYTGESTGEIMVNGEDFRYHRKKRIGLGIGSEILITAGEPYQEARITFKNENIAT